MAQFGKIGLLFIPTSGHRTDRFIGPFKYLINANERSETRKTIKIRAYIFKGRRMFQWANPGLFFIYFRSFQTNNTILTTTNVMSIRYTVQGFEPTTSRTLSSPLTTKPGLPGIFWMAPMMANS